MTTQKYAILDGTEVVNVILLDGSDNFTPPSGHTVIPAEDHVSMGWRWISDEWLSPEEPQPEPEPSEDPDVLAAKYEAVDELMELGISEATARRIVSLPMGV